MSDETNSQAESNVSAESQKTTPNTRGLLHSGLLVSAMTMMSRVLGLVRDIVLAAVLGGVASGGQAGAFYVAFKVPQFLRRLFAEGAFAQAFVPVLSEYQEQHSRQQVRELIDKVNGALTVSLLCVVLLGVLGSNVLAYIVAPGFADQPEKFAMTESLLKITFPYLLLISLAGFLGSILNSNNRFVAPAFTPIWLNVCLIAAGTFYAQFTDSPATALAYGILIAGVVQLFFLMPFVYRLGLFPRFKFDLSHPGVKRILTLMLPALLGVSVAQVNLVIDTILATNLPEGSIAWLYFSQRISDLPLGVFAIAISTVILPTLSRQFANNNESKFAPTLDWGVRFVLMIAVPSVIALCVLAQPILTSLFLYGKTTPLDIVMSSYSLQAYSIGIIFFMLIKILVPGYFARQDMKTPVRIAIIAMAANILLNILFVIPLHTHFRLGHVGLALATSCSAMLNVYLLFRGLVKHGVYQVQPGFYRQMITFGLAAVLMGCVLYFGQSVFGSWEAFTAFDRVWRLLLLCVTGAAVYFGVLFGSGLRISHFKQSA